MIPLSATIAVAVGAIFSHYYLCYLENYIGTIMPSPGSVYHLFEIKKEQTTIRSEQIKRISLHVSAEFA